MKGLYRINREGQIRKAEYSSTRVVSEQIRGFVEDDEQNIWFGTFDGLQVYNPYSDIRIDAALLHFLPVLSG